MSSPGKNIGKPLPRLTFDQETHNFQYDGYIIFWNPAPSLYYNKNVCIFY